jgi:hypothetical protein
MSDGRAWRKNYQSNTETVIRLIRECVSALRSRGMKTDAALQDLSPLLQTTQRRIRTLYHCDYEPVVIQYEWASLLYRAGLFFLNQAAWHRAKAAEYETAGENLVADQMEFRWGNECENYAERRSGRCTG